MTKQLPSYFLYLFSLPFTVCAGEMGGSSETFIPNSALSIGVGGNYNSVKLDRYFDTVNGTSNVYSGSTLIAKGAAGGPAAPFHSTQTTFSPTVSADYFRYFADSDRFLWGVKFQYQYLGITISDPEIVIPQAGSYANTESAPVNTTFTGRATIGSLQSNINHELALVPFLGTSYKNTYVYLGAGPSLFESATNIYNLTGFASINGVPANISGVPGNYPGGSTWVVGGVGQVGMTYFMPTGWSLDLNYSYAVTKDFDTQFSGIFNNQLSSGYTNDGTLLGIISQRITSQSLSATVKKVFLL